MDEDDAPAMQWLEETLHRYDTLTMYHSMFLR